MKLVIDIPKEYYETLKEMSDETLSMDMAIIKYGTPLPEHHGRLIDADDIALIDEQFYVPSDYYVAESAINDAPTIIEGSESE